MGKTFLPALRGVFGDWIYYSCLMPGMAVAERVNFAGELHKSKKLSELIQREIKGKRGLEIANYLRTQKERFFGSMVIAVYGGKPTWYEVDIQSNNKDLNIDEISDFALHSFGFLLFSGKEKLFALDGQHRLAGIRKAKEEGATIEDELSVIFVAHNNTPSGLQRTRRLFTTLNKTAVPVSKSEIIALDENDVMAIIARRLVEDNPNFSGNRIAYKATNNLSQNDTESLTTIGNLYDVLGVLFGKILRSRSLKQLQVRPTDDELDGYYIEACNFFDLLAKYIPELDRYFRASNFSSVVKKYRGDFGGSLIFRPIGLAILAECIEKLSKKFPLEKSIEIISQLPRSLTEEPLAGTLWDTYSHVMVNKRRVLARNLMLYMLGENKAENELLKNYASAMGKEVDEVELPPVLFR